MLLELPSKAQPVNKSVENLKEKIEKLENQLKNLEPSEPKDIEDPPWEEIPFPTKELQISEVILEGTNIPFKVIVNKPDFKRLAYDENWHSTIGRWSYVPTRTHYSLHRLFTNYDLGLSGWYDFEHNLGLSVPMFQSVTDLDMYIVSFQTEVTNVYTKGNQVVVVGNPNRKGVQAITIKTGDIHPINKEESILVQLATSEGYEMDYSLISYVPSDFRLKQREKLNAREEGVNNR